MTENITYDIYPEDELVLVRATGELTLDSLLSSAAEIRSDARRELAYSLVWDFRAVKIASSLEAIRQLVSAIAVLPGHGLPKLALLVDTPHITALAIIFEQLSSNLHEVKTFSTLAAAGDWLDINLFAYLQDSQ